MEKAVFTNMCMIERDGMVLMQERNDEDWPGVVFPGGHVEEGESFTEAVIREVREETGLDVSEAEGGFLFSYHRENPGTGDNYFVDVYRFVMDFTEEDVHLQTEETTAFEIAGPDRLKELADQGIFLHYDSIRQALG